MDEIETKAFVAAAGDELSDGTRAAVRASIAGALRGTPSTPVANVVALPPGRGRSRLWVAFGAVAAAVAVVTVAIAVQDDDHRVLTPSTEQPETTSATTLPGPSTVPDSTTLTTTPVTTTPVTTTPATTVTTTVRVVANTAGLISPDSAKVALTTTPVGLLPASPTSDPTKDVVTFLPDGTIFALDPVAGTVSILDPKPEAIAQPPGTGTVGPLAGRTYTLAPTLVKNRSLWSGAYGPDDVAYLSYRIDPLLSDGPIFLLEAVPLTGPKALTVVKEWTTDWQCVETTCGEVTLGDTGVLVRGKQGAPDSVVAGYVAPDGSPFEGTYAAPAKAATAAGPDTIAVPADYGTGPFFGWPSTKVSAAGHSWLVDVLGVKFAEGEFTTFVPQTDGGVLALFSVTKDPQQLGQHVVLSLQPDGTQGVYQLPKFYEAIAAATIDGQLYGILSTGDGYELDRLMPATGTGPVTPLPPTPVLLPPDLTAPPRAVDWVTPLDGWLLPEYASTSPGNYLQHTIDGGKNWTFVSLPAGGLADVTTVHIADATNGWVVSPTELLATHDGGASWNPVTLGAGTWSPYLAESSGGFVHVMAGDETNQTGLHMFVAPVGSDTFVESPVVLPYGAGPVFDGQLVVDGTHGWATYGDRGLIAAATLKDGKWVDWKTPCDVQDGSGSADDVNLSIGSHGTLVVSCVTTPFASPPTVARLFSSSDGGATFTALPPLPPLGDDIDTVNFIWQSPSGTVFVGYTGRSSGASVATLANGAWTSTTVLEPNEFIGAAFDIAGTGLGLVVSDGTTVRGVVTYDDGATWGSIQTGTVPKS